MLWYNHSILIKIIIQGFIMDNLYIALDGVEGGGKSGSLRLLEGIFEQRGEIITSVREPGGTPMAEDLRSLIKRIYDEEVDSVTEIMVMFAARRQLLLNLVIPALQRGHVLSDRCYASSLAYQLFGSRSITDSQFESIFDLTMKGVPEIDLLLWLDVDPKLGIERARSRGELDRIEKNHMDFFYRAREGYQSLIGKPGVVRIDANVSEPEMHEQIKEVLDDFFVKKGFPGLSKK
jgi:dTMP kinase